MGLTQNLGRLSGVITHLNGNIGINTTSPTYTLDISGTLRATGAAAFSSSVTLDGATNPTLRLNGAVGGSPTIRLDQNGVNKGWMYLTSGGVLQINNDATDGKGIALNGNNVGIGTTSPSYPLTVISNGSTQGFRLAGRASDGIGNMSFTSNDQATEYAFINTASSYLAIGTNGSERMRITSGGRGLYGTTTPSAGADNFGSRSFQVNNEVVSMGSLAGFFFENRSGGVTSTSNWYGWYAISGVTYFYNGSSNIASINTSNGIYTPLSDVNKKKDFEESTIGLNAILGLKPTLFRMKGEDETTEKHLGFIAQEVKEFIPQAYVQTKGENEDFIGLNDRAIIAVLTKAIQELKQELDELKNKIN